MKLEDLHDRDVLTVTRDVENPDADRRMTRRFDALPVWKAGTRLLFRSNGYPRVDDDTLYGSVSHTHEGFKALLDACEKAPRTLSNVLYRARLGDACTRATDVLETLLFHGKLTLADVEDAVAEYEQKERSQPEDES